MRNPDGPTFLACATLPAYDDAVTRWQAEGAGVVPVPVWTGERHDLLDSLVLAEQVYDGLRHPAPSDSGLVIGAPLPAPLQTLVGPLARTWARDVSEMPEAGSVLIVGTYAELRASAVQDIVERCHEQGRDLFLLTGRDVHTLSWMVAKQYGRAVPEGAAGVVSEHDTRPPAPGVLWFGADDVRHEDVQEFALGRVWRRLLLHGNGKDDQLNLGQFTVCGLSPVGERRPDMAGPKCAYGLGCPKPEDKLIPAQRLRAAELVLANCFSGPLSDHAMYDPKYVILLNALDGPAQTVLATLTACDAQRPEILAWVAAGVSGGSAARVINERLADINPYPAFVQAGLSSYGPSEAAEPAADDPGPPLHTVGARLGGLLDSGLLADSYPLRPRLRKLADSVLRDAVRTVVLSTPDHGVAARAIADEVKSLDLALAHRFAKHHDDPVLQFPTYWGERSVAEAPVPVEQPCACGLPVRSYVRRGRVPVVVDTVQAVCARCGDVVNSFLGAPELLVKAEQHTAPGSRLHVVVEAVAEHAGTINMGIVLPTYLLASVQPVLRRVEVDAGERAHAEFTVQTAPEAAPQAYYFTPYAVHGLGIATRRVHFTLAPAPDVTAGSSGEELL
ncbi:hypothetical protein [Streptomyces altiplanensis]